jgi:hypothetical protein
MVVKKKRTYKKQKGGLVILPNIPKKLKDYFNFVKIMIDFFNSYTDENLKRHNVDKSNKIITIFEKIKKICANNIHNLYILRLSNILLGILSNYFKCFLYKTTMESFVKTILYNLFINEENIFDYRHLRGVDLRTTITTNFEDNLIAIFINMLFIEYIRNIPDMMENINKLLDIFHFQFRDIGYLMYLIKELFLKLYPKGYDGVPVFYGNIHDGLINYNQFICEKVGISSKEKRNYIINPVGAFIHKCIDNRGGHRSVYNPIINKFAELISKILRFKIVPGNKTDFEFKGLPKLKHLTGPSKFCIAVNHQIGCEEIVQSSTIFKCSKIYGCSLETTPVIREENIASDEHILELLSILLEEQLDKRVSNNIVRTINEYVVSPSRTELQTLRPIQEFNNQQVNPQVKSNRDKLAVIYGQQKKNTMGQNNTELINFKKRIINAITEINKELKKGIYSQREIKRLNVKRDSLATHLREIS